MKKFYNLGYLLGCCFLNPEGAIEANTGSGILQNHAYGILETNELDKNRRLIRIST